MKGHSIAWLKEALGLVLEKECFETTIYFQTKRIDPFFMLQIIIFNNWSTERNLKLLFLKKKQMIFSHFRNAPYYMLAKSLAKVK